MMVMTNETPAAAVLFCNTDTPSGTRRRARGRVQIRRVRPMTGGHLASSRRCAPGSRRPPGHPPESAGYRTDRAPDVRHGQSAVRLLRGSPSLASTISNLQALNVQTQTQYRTGPATPWGIAFSRQLRGSEQVYDHAIVVRRRPTRTRIEEPTIAIPTLMKPKVTRASCQG